MPYPDNPNGSIDNIAGVCDASGLVCGLMPHPERYIDPDAASTLDGAAKARRWAKDCACSKTPCDFSCSVNFVDQAAMRDIGSRELPVMHYCMAYWTGRTVSPY